MVLIFLEYLIVHSATKLAVSWANTKQLQKMADFDRVPWSLQHTLLADMGGIEIRFDRRKEVTRDCCVGSDQYRALVAANTKIEMVMNSRGLLLINLTRRRRLSLHVLMEQPASGHKGLEAQDPSNLEDVEIPEIGPIAASAINTCRLDSSYLALAKEHNIIETMPHIEREEIADRNKTDGLVKLLAILQVIWLIAQLATRKYLGLPTTTLEINTAAIAASAFCLYVIEWIKPKDVGVLFYVKASPGTSYESFAEKVRTDRHKPTSLETGRYYISNKKTAQCCPGKHKLDPRTMHLVASIISIPLFGVIHLFAWNYTFPTPFEQFLWRICAIISVAAPFEIAIMTFLLFKILDGSKVLEISFGLLAPFTMLVYPAARIFLIIESLRSLCYLSPDNFTATWAANAPHLG